MGKKIKRICKQCGKEFKVWPYIAKRGGGKFCSISCGTTYRNLHDNPNPYYNPNRKKQEKETRPNMKGKNNPMYGVRLIGKKNPSYIDGRSKYGEYYRMVAFENKECKCEVCGKEGKPKDFHVHHKNKNRKNNKLQNLIIACPSCHRKTLHKRERDELGRFKKVAVNG